MEWGLRCLGLVRRRDVGNIGNGILRMELPGKKKLPQRRVRYVVRADKQSVGVTKDEEISKIWKRVILPSDA